jgi:PAS domain S-box-containing protein
MNTYHLKQKLFDQTMIPVMALSILSNFGLILTLYYNKVLNEVILIISMSIILNLYRALKAKQRLKVKIFPQNYLYHLCGTSAFSGLLTGTIYSYIVSHQNPALMMISLIILAGTVAAGASLYSFFPKVGFTYSLISIIPVSITLMLSFNFNSVMVGILTLMFGATICITIKKSGKFLDESLTRMIQLDELNLDIAQSKTLLQKTLDQMPGPIYSVDSQGKIIFVNQKFKNNFKHLSDNLIGLKMEQIFPREVSELMDESNNFVINNHEHVNLEETQVINGKEVIFDTYKFPLLDSLGVAYAMTGVSIDITERKNAENELEAQRKIAQHSSKLASIGELTAGVGHEINNPLAIVMGKINAIEKMLKGKPANVDGALEELSKMNHASKRIKDIVQGLRTFARADNLEVTRIDLNQLMNDTINMVREIFYKEGVLIKVKNYETPLWIQANYGKIQQVIINLISNAKDATEGNREREINIQLGRDLNNCFFSVCDNGKGIPRDLRQKIFEPFYTTKSVNKGTGIGLALIHNIVKDHKGTILLESEENKGSIFKVQIPIDHLEEKPSKIKEIKIDPISASGKLLLVDDEEGIRELLSEMLTDIGFEVTAASNAQEGLEKWLNGNFDFVLSDMKMPVLDGPSLVKLIRSYQGRVQPVIFLITGGVNINFEDKTSEINRLIEGYLYKPFDFDQMSRLLTPYLIKRDKSA